jgi:hypothetical protein
MKRDRRRDKRVRPDNDVLGTVKTNLPARVLDYSPGGMQVELVSPLPPNTECAVCLPLEGTEVRVRARVRRCRAATLALTEGAEKGVVYRAGLEFVDLDEESCALIEDAVVEQTLTASVDTEPGADGSPTPIKIRVDTGE